MYVFMCVCIYVCAYVHTSCNAHYWLHVSLCSIIAAGLMMPHLCENVETRHNVLADTMKLLNLLSSRINLELPV